VKFEEVDNEKKEIYVRTQGHVITDWDKAHTNFIDLRNLQVTISYNLNAFCCTKTV